MSTISQRIKELRMAADMTQKDLSDRLSLTPKMISFYELGQRVPPLDIVLKLASVFNVTTDYLLLNVPVKPTADMCINTFNEEESDIISMYRELDDKDKGEIKGTIKQMLKQEKYIDLYHTRLAKTK